MSAISRSCLKYAFVKQFFASDAPTWWSAPEQYVLRLSVSSASDDLFFQTYIKAFTPVCRTRWTAVGVFWPKKGFMVHCTSLATQRTGQKRAKGIFWHKVLLANYQASVKLMVYAKKTRVLIELKATHENSKALVYFFFFKRGDRIRWDGVGWIEI